jgi:hypothetical protein
MPKPIVLSICICSLPQRVKTLTALLESLWKQARSDEIEILVAADAGGASISEKRNRLVQVAMGAYVVHVDDDDSVSPRYVSAILEAIDRAPHVDCVLIRGERTCAKIDARGRTLATEKIVFDYRLGVPGYVQKGKDGVLWRTPGHLCPVRADIAKRVPFPPLPGVGEDVAWVSEIAPLLHTAERAGKPGEVLYLYRYEPRKVTPALEARPTPLGPGSHMTQSHTQIFTPQYKDRSGPGSTAEFSAPYRQFLEAFVREHKIDTIVDLGCGDMEVMSRVALGGARYYGIDCIADRVIANRKKCPAYTFAQGEFQKLDIPEADLVLCKDVIQHWSTEDVAQWLAKLATQRQRYCWALITNCNYGQTVNTPITTGGWRALDLTRPPFSVGHIVFTWGTPPKDVVMIEGTRAMRPASSPPAELADQLGTPA